MKSFLIFYRAQYFCYKINPLLTKRFWSRWLDMAGCLVLFSVFMDLNFVLVYKNTQKKNSANIPPCWLHPWSIMHIHPVSHWNINVVWKLLRIRYLFLIGSFCFILIERLFFLIHFLQGSISGIINNHSHGIIPSGIRWNLLSIGVKSKTPHYQVSKFKYIAQKIHFWCVVLLGILTS